MSAMLLDAASMYFRAYHAVPTSVRAADGTPVNAIRGFLDMMATLVARFRPTHLVACWDADWRPTWRVALVPSYKAHRVAQDAPEEEAAPDDLKPQVPILAGVLAALGIATAEAPGYEADDVIATLATRLRAERDVDVVTGDRDLFALIAPPDRDGHAVRVVYTGAGVAKLAVMGADELAATYGVSPAQYADVAVLRGDSSDGLPGVPGIGEKTAVRLVTTFGSLAEVIAASQRGDGRITPRVAASINQQRGYLDAAAQVVGLVRDIPLGEFTTAAPAAPADAQQLEELAQRYNLTNPIKRLSAVLYE